MTEVDLPESESGVSRRKKSRELDPGDLEALLAALSPDRETAGEKYEGLRRRLINLFAWERCQAPEELADEALDRLARRLIEGADVPHLDRFAFGIARMLLQEDSRRQRDLKVVMLEPSPTFFDPRSHEDWTSMDALERCLESLPQSSRELIKRYYGEDRTALAHRFGVTITALRMRAMRIRAELFACVSRRLES